MPDLKWNLRHKIKTVTCFLNYIAMDSHWAEKPQDLVETVKSSSTLASKLSF